MRLLKAKGETYKAVDDVDLGPNSNEFYLRANVKAPRMAGFLVKVFVWFLEIPIFGSIMLYFLKSNNLIHKLVTFAELQESPLYVPLHSYEGKEEEKEVICVEYGASPSEQVGQASGCLQSILEAPKYSFSRWTILDYSRAYNSKLITPRKVIDRFLSAVHRSSTSSMQMSFFINFDAEDMLRQATMSTNRYEQGEALSVLDGVPIAIKDEIDCMPYPTTGGTKWMHKVRGCKDDAECVRRLRSCGAILVGKTNMHELGAGTSGINPHHGTTRNPYNVARIAGGSSSGSAAVVAAGLCPAALGVDGGGSVRMPAALCGVVGFKPSFGRISHSGILPLNWTVGMVGILAATVEDALLVYAAITSPKSSDQSETAQAKLCFPLLKSPKLIPNIKLAKYGEWFNDCSDDIRVCCSQALAKLYNSYGWKTIEVTVPEIEVMRLAHYVTIGSECNNSIARELEKLNKEELGWDARVALSVYGSFSSQEYLNAQRIRNRQLQIHKRIFSKADVIVTPTTGVTAYTIQKDARETGELDYINGAALVRYQIAGNFLGLPAVTIPVGYDMSGLPIGLQFIGKPWNESLLIHIAFAMQAKLCFPLLKSPKLIPNIKLAKYGEWFNDCSDDIRVCCSQALAKLYNSYGWKTIEVTVPEIEVMRLAHYVTIGSECNNSIARELEKLNKEELGWDARVALSVYGSFSSQEYLNAQRIRNRQLQIHKRIFSKADVIVTPTTGVTAYTIQKDARETGELDYINGAALVRYQIAGNFLGLPAVTIPVGYDMSGLPIGLQFIGKPWNESLLIHIAFAMQALCISEYKRPEVFFDLLGK